MKELVLRVRALLRRSGAAEANRLVIGAAVLDANRNTIERGGEKVELPSKEFQLLFRLLSTPGRAYTRMQLLDEVWGWDTESSEATVNVHVNRLRSRFEDWPDLPSRRCAASATAQRSEKPMKDNAHEDVTDSLSLFRTITLGAILVAVFAGAIMGVCIVLAAIGAALTFSGAVSYEQLTAPSPLHLWCSSYASCSPSSYVWPRTTHWCGLCAA